MSLFSNTASQKIAALNRSQAIIEFALDGTILHANENFLKAMGYILEEVKGKHHSSLLIKNTHNLRNIRIFGLN